MAHEPNKPGEGVLFPNSDENPHPKAPGHRGRMTCPECKEELSISAWVNFSKRTGAKYLKLALDKYVSAKTATPPAEGHRLDTHRDQQGLPY
jgi:hypothetical protein